MSIGDAFYTPLGRTGMKVSRLCLGTVNFGGRVEEPEAHALLDHAVANGINFVDTADIYGWRVHKGHTEEVIGRWWSGHPERRDGVVLATKVGEPMSEMPGDAGLSARHVIAGCEASLRRLQTDRIDLYQMHRADPLVGWDEVWEGLATLVEQGKVRHVGSSNFSVGDLAAAQATARRLELPGLQSEQCVYNLATRGAEHGILPAARAEGIAVLPWAPLGGGLLGGMLRKLAAGTAVKSAQGRAVASLPRWRAAVEVYESFCADAGRDPAELALAWVLSRPGITAPVIGARTPGQLDGAVAALHLNLTADESLWLETLFPSDADEPVT